MNLFTTTLVHVPCQVLHPPNVIELDILLGLTSLMTVLMARGHSLLNYFLIYFVLNACYYFARLMQSYSYSPIYSHVLLKLVLRPHLFFKLSLKVMQLTCQTLNPRHFSWFEEMFVAQKKWFFEGWALISLRAEKDEA